VCFPTNFLRRWLNGLRPRPVEFDRSAANQVGNIAREMKRMSQPYYLLLVLAAFLLLLSHAIIVSAQSESTPPPFPPPGKLIDIGGWRLHLNCTGEVHASQLTVLLEAGKGDFSVEWSLVQPGVAKFVRVCSYDRAGDGWSDLGPHPRTFHQIVYELHTLLDKAGVKPPFVLVGHSYGGWLVRLYASIYPTEVAGMVLVEAGADNPWRKLPDGKLVRAAELATGRPIPAVKVSNPLRISDIPPGALSQMKAGLEDVAKARERSSTRQASHRRSADAHLDAWAVGPCRRGSQPVRERRACGVAR
jgi:pimeloyl-ACP methyl ester carboxylesterase